MDAIEVKNLSKRFNGLTAVDRVTFTVHQGKIFGFLGPNGAGKTTTVRMLTGVINLHQRHLYPGRADAELGCRGGLTLTTDLFHRSGAVRHAGRCLLPPLRGFRSIARLIPHSS
jgi:ABC-type hemin transport system ATPase subunit